MSTVIHLLYTTGHTASTGADLIRADLVELALDLARMLLALMPDEAAGTRGRPASPACTPPPPTTPRPTGARSCGSTTNCCVGSAAPAKPPSPTAPRWTSPTTRSGPAAPERGSRPLRHSTAVDPGHPIDGSRASPPPDVRRRPAPVECDQSLGGALASTEVMSPPAERPEFPRGCRSSPRCRSGW